MRVLTPRSPITEAKARRWHVGRVCGCREVELFLPGYRTRWAARRYLRHLRHLLGADATPHYDVYRVKAT